MSELPPPDEAPLLFCPFCRECYEGEAHCPVHELELVDFTDLPKQAHEREAVRWDEPVAPWDIRYGRGWVALGVALTVLGCFLPLASGRIGQRAFTWTTLELANGNVPNLWTIPFAAAVFLVFLYRRQTPIAMRGARLAAILVALAPALSLIYSVRNILRGVEGLHGAVGLSWGSGLYVLAAGALALLIGGFRFGKLPKSAATALRRDLQSAGDDPAT